MIEEQRYCVDILVQFRAVQAALRAVELSILGRHLRSCVKGALTSKSVSSADTKIDELIGLLSNRSA